MPRQITTRSTLGKRYTPISEVSKISYRNGKTIHTTATSRNLPSGEVQKASSQRVIVQQSKPVQYIAPKVYKQLPKPAPRLSQHQHRSQPLTHNIDDVYGGFLLPKPVQTRVQPTKLPPAIQAKPRGIRPISSQGLFGYAYTDYY